MRPAQALQQEYERAVQRRALVADPAQGVVLARLGRLADCLHDTPPPGLLRRWLARQFPGLFRVHTCRGIYLWGEVGRGKTWLVDLFCSLQRPPDVERLHFQHLMREVHRQLRQGQGHERPLRQVAASFARRARVLCIDEFGVHDIGDAMLLHGLLEALLLQGVVLVCTSNTPPRRLYANGLQRARFLPAIDLLEAQLDVLEIGAGPDYRLRELGASATWFDSKDAATEGRMERLFAALAGGPEGTSTQVEIEGRNLPARRVAHGMLWFDFATLCEGPRSAGDYIALADEWHTLFLSGIPVFTHTGDDAARRFISLVDELYDRRVKLVASAAASPEELYQGERLRDSFARTASRLVEMRGHAYLGGAHVSGVVPRERA